MRTLGLEFTQLVTSRGDCHSHEVPGEIEPARPCSRPTHIQFLPDSAPIRVVVGVAEVSESLLEVAVKLG